MLIFGSTIVFCPVADVDYMSSVPSVQFATFQQRQFVPIRILDDQIIEGDELFTLSLLVPPSVRGVLLNISHTQITILENDCEYIPPIHIHVATTAYRSVGEQ